MRVIFKHIVLMLVTGLFLALSTGVYVTIHHCSAEDFTGLYLFSALEDDPCTHHTADHHAGSYCENHDNHTGTCSMSCKMPDCCSNTILYLAVDDDYVKSDQQAAQANITSMLSDSGMDLINKDQHSQHIKTILFTDPPPALSGKELNLFIGTLLL